MGNIGIISQLEFIPKYSIKYTIGFVKINFITWLEKDYFY
jgi:hypothetical protein